MASPIPIDELLRNENLIPHLSEAKTRDEVRAQIAVLSTAIERCERLLQHTIAGGNFDNNFDLYMTSHLSLIGERNRLYNKLEREEKEQVAEETYNHS